MVYGVALNLDTLIKSINNSTLLNVGGKNSNDKQNNNESSNSTNTYTIVDNNNDAYGV